MTSFADTSPSPPGSRGEPAPRAAPPGGLRRPDARLEPEPGVTIDWPRSSASSGRGVEHVRGDARRLRRDPAEVLGSRSSSGPGAGGGRDMVDVEGERVPLAEATVEPGTATPPPSLEGASLPPRCALPRPAGAMRSASREERSCSVISGSGPGAPRRDAGVLDGLSRGDRRRAARGPADAELPPGGAGAQMTGLSANRSLSGGPEACTSRPRRASDVRIGR